MSKKTGSVLGLLLIISFVSVAIAETPRWKADQYVVTVDKSSSGHSFGGYVEQKLSDDTLLIKPELQYLSSDSEEVPQSAYDFCQKLIEDGAVSSCSPNFEIKISATPNDAHYSRLWGMNYVEATTAWDKATGGDAAVMAVVDTGVDYRHPDLVDNIWTNPGEVEGDGVDNDGNGVIDDVHGFNGADGSGDPMDAHGHGTHCSGTMAGAGNNGIGVSGINWRGKVMGVRFMGADGRGDLSAAIRGINYVIEQKKRGVNVRVMNNSWGGGGYSEPLRSAIDKAGQAGIVFVAAAGNDTNDNDSSPSYPAAYDLPNVIAVGAVGQDGALASFSNYGAQSVKIAAPGVSILSTIPNGQYGYMSGTSMASPHVAGAFGLLFSTEPNLTVSDAIKRMIDSGVEQDALKGKIKDGRSLNVRRLILNETNPAPVLPVCKYSVSKIGFASDSNVWAQQMLEGSAGDDVSASIPFGMNFLGTSISFITASSNNVVYFGRERDSLDFISRSLPSSLKVGHLDLKQVEGIKSYSKSDGSIVVAFKGSFPGELSSEYVKAEARISPDGAIKVFFSGKQSVLDVINDEGEISVTSVNGEKFKYNGKVSDKMGVQFTPQCGDSLKEEPAKVRKISVKLSKRNVKVSLRGEGTGEVPVSVKVNDIQCSGNVYVGLQDGKGTFSRKLPGNITSRISVKVRAGRASGQTVSSVKRIEKASAQIKKISTRICRSIVK